MPKGKQHYLLVIGLGLALVPALMLGQSVRPPAPPIMPRAEPGRNVDRLTRTSAIPLPSNAIPSNPVPFNPLPFSPIPFNPMPAMPSEVRDIGTLKAGLDALAAGDVVFARKYRDGLPDDALDRHILTWAIAMSGQPEVSSGEIAAAAQILSQWPGAATLKENSERALYRERPDPQTVIATFGDNEPETVAGVRMLARAHLALGEPEAARAVLSPFWRTAKLEASDETAVIKEFGKVLSSADHRFRMERMLYAERPRSAQRVAALAGATQLADAWAAVLRGDKKAGKLLGAVPAAQRSAGYAFAEAKYLRRTKKFSEAAAIMLKAPRDKASLVDPDEWWTERRVLARELVDHGDIKTAYKLVAAHSAEQTNNIVDAEFHAGWYALRGLGDPKMASRHFARIAEVADGPLSLSRAYYWLGRAAEAGGPGNATAYYQKAAVFGTAFYGQLAAARIGSSRISVDYPEASGVDRQNFAKREAVRAIGRLEEAGYASRADILYRDLAKQMASPGELAMLAAMAEKRGDHYLALRVGKIAAAAHELNIGSLSHPVGVIPASANMSGAGKALAYAIARQESEFNVGAVSGAGARGLLQLLPGTAKDVAKRSGLVYSKERLTTDAGYNATLGAAFLSEQLGRFDGSYVLTFAGYNAGPRRAREWVAKYGDPRGKSLDAVVDWIERIPFTETRGYVQRVMENYEVYKMRLSGKFDIASDLVNGR